MKTLAIGIGRGLVAEHDGDEGQCLERAYGGDVPRDVEKGSADVAG